MNEEEKTEEKTSCEGQLPALRVLSVPLRAAGPTGEVRNKDEHKR